MVLALVPHCHFCLCRGVCVCEVRDWQAHRFFPRFSWGCTQGRPSVGAPHSKSFFSVSSISYPCVRVVSSQVRLQPLLRSPSPRRCRVEKPLRRQQRLRQERLRRPMDDKLTSSRTTLRVTDRVGGGRGRGGTNLCSGIWFAILPIPAGLTVDYIFRVTTCLQYGGVFFRRFSCRAEKLV